MNAFVFNAHPARVVFGSGTLNSLEAEMVRANMTRALVLCTPQQRAQGEALMQRLGQTAAGLFDGAVMHVPIEVAREARVVAERTKADCAIAIGGGSTIGLGKAIALDSGLPVLAIPTTYAGSEMTPIFGITEGGLKTTGTDPRVLPKVVIYDVDLTLDLPVAMSVTSGINAIAHAAEGLYARDANPIVSLMAEEGIRSLGEGLPGIHHDSRDVDARACALYGAWLCGSVLGAVGMSLHHKLCHTLGGSFDLPHAETHAVVLPHALAYNAHAARPAMDRIAAALQVPDAALGILRLARDHGAPTSLRELGMKISDLDRAADLAMRGTYWSPRPLEHGAIRRLLKRAYDGAVPATD